MLGKILASLNGKHSILEAYYARIITKGCDQACPTHDEAARDLREQLAHKRHAELAVP